MPSVQDDAKAPWRTIVASSAAVLSALLVLLALALPRRLEDLVPGAFLRLPVEAIVYLAVVLALPRDRRRLHVLVALAAGTLLGVAALLRLLDMGFLETLNRPFDALVDWRYAGALVDTVRDSVGPLTGTAMLVAAALVAVVFLVVLPLSVLRLTRLAARHRRSTTRAVVVLAVVWVALALLHVRGTTGMVATSDTAHYLYGQVSRIPSALRDQREFTEATERDPARAVPVGQQLTGLRGKDVLFVFVESYGRVAVEGSWFSPGVRAVLARGTRRLAAAGFSGRSAWLTSPTFGGVSWLAHATLQSGLWVDSQQRYNHLVTSRRLTLSRLFGAAGWRTVGDIPANRWDWPQGAYYGYDTVYDSRNVGYRGPRFGYPTMPDQYTLDAFHRLELARRHRPPVMAEIDLISSHIPWSRTPRMVPQAEVGDGSVFDGMPEQLPSEGDIWPSPRRVQEAYGDSIEYSLTALFSFLSTYGDEDTVVVFLGDHQPATIVSGHDADRDVPVTVVARDPAVLRRIAGWGWDEGLRPSSRAPVWRMDAFRDRFLDAFGSADATRMQAVSGR